MTLLDFGGQRSRLQQSVEVEKASTSMLGCQSPIIWCMFILCYSIFRLQMQAWLCCVGFSCFGTMLSDCLGTLATRGKGQIWETYLFSLDSAAAWLFQTHYRGTRDHTGVSMWCRLPGGFSCRRSSAHFWRTWSVVPNLCSMQPSHHMSECQSPFQDYPTQKMHCE